MSAGAIRSFNETLRTPDTVLTSVSGATGALPDLDTIRRTPVLTGNVFSRDAYNGLSFDPAARGGDGELHLGGYSYPATITANAVFLPNQTPSVLPVCPIVDPICDPSIPPAAIGENIQRVGRKAVLSMSTIAFPSPGRSLVPSAGATCGSTGLACDPAGTPPYTCFTGACDVLGGAVADQTVTLDDEVGTMVGNPFTQNGSPDGFVLHGGEFIVFIVDAALGPLPVNAAASGFLIDADGRVVDAIGP